MFIPESVRAKLRPTLGLSRKKPRRVGRSVTGSPSQHGPLSSGCAGGPLGCLEVAHRSGEQCRAGWRVGGHQSPPGAPLCSLRQHRYSWGPAALHPPTPELLPQATGSVGVSNSVRFHLHDLQQQGVRGQRTFGSVSGTVMGKASSATQMGLSSPQRLPAHKAGWTWWGQDSTSRFSGVSGAPCSGSPAMCVVQS